MPFTFPDVSLTRPHTNAVPPNIVRFSIGADHSHKSAKFLRFAIGLEVVTAAHLDAPRASIIIGVDRGLVCLRQAPGGRTLNKPQCVGATYRVVSFPVDRVTLLDRSGQLLEPSIYCKCPTWRVDGQNLILTLPTVEDVKKQEDAYCMDREA